MIIYSNTDAKITIITYPKVGSSTIQDIIDRNNTSVIGTWTVDIHDQVFNPLRIAELIPTDHQVYFVYREPVDRYISGFTFYCQAVCHFFSTVQHNIDFENYEWVHNHVKNILTLAKHDYNIDLHCNRRLLDAVAIQSFLCYAGINVFAINLNNLDDLIVDIFGKIDFTRSNQTSTGWHEVELWSYKHAPELKKAFKQVIVTEIHKTENKEYWADILSRFLLVDRDIYNFYESLKHNNASSPGHRQVTTEGLRSLLITFSNRHNADSGYFTTGEFDPGATGSGFSYIDLLYNWAIHEKDKEIFTRIYSFVHTHVTNEAKIALETLCKLSNPYSVSTE